MIKEPVVNYPRNHWEENWVTYLPCNCLWELSVCIVWKISGQCQSVCCVVLPELGLVYLPCSTVSWWHPNLYPQGTHIVLTSYRIFFQAEQIYATFSFFPRFFSFLDYLPVSWEKEGKWTAWMLGTRKVMLSPGRNPHWIYSGSSVKLLVSC